MIKTIAAIAAFAALPALASAQGWRDDSSITILGQRPGSYSIVIQTAGKSPREVEREIVDAANTACERAPSTGDIMADRPPAFFTCVGAAEREANDRYAAIRQAYGYGY